MIVSRIGRLDLLVIREQDVGIDAIALANTKIVAMRNCQVNFRTGSFS